MYAADLINKLYELRHTRCRDSRCVAFTRSDHSWNCPTVFRGHICRDDYDDALTTATQSWRVRRKRRQTNCNECWTPQPVWSAIPISSTEACRDSSIPSYIGWMSLSESCTNSASWCSTACTVKRLRTSWNCANQSQVSHHGNISDSPPNNSRSYRALSSYGRRAFCVADPSVWNSLPDSLRDSVIGGNSFRQSLKTFLFATYWCIRRIRGFTTMRYINRLFTYLFTYCDNILEDEVLQKLTILQIILFSSTSFVPPATLNRAIDQYSKCHSDLSTVNTVAEMLNSVSTGGC